MSRELLQAAVAQEVERVILCIVLFFSFLYIIPWFTVLNKRKRRQVSFGETITADCQLQTCIKSHWLMLEGHWSTTGDGPTRSLFTKILADMTSESLTDEQVHRAALRSAQVTCTDLKRTHWNLKPYLRLLNILLRLLNDKGLKAFSGKYYNQTCYNSHWEH